MCTGRTHARASCLAAPIIGTATALLVNPQAGALVALGCLAGVVVSPDLDQETVTRSEWWIIHHSFGLGWLWVLATWPYARLMPHRSWWSHAPLVGTLGRVVYFGAFALLLLWVFDLRITRDSAMLLLPVAGGLAASDLLHWLMD